MSLLHALCTIGKSKTATSPNPRRELEHILLELGSRASKHVDPSRLQLALRGLREPPGKELVRVAVHGLDATIPTARRVFRALLADPLRDEEDWERELETLDPKSPFLVRTFPTTDDHVTFVVEDDAARLRELHVSSPELNGLDLEFVLTESLAPANQNAGTATMAPVHRTLFIAAELRGAVNASTLPTAGTAETDDIKVALQMEGVTNQQLRADFDLIDVSLAEEGVQLFRQGPQHGMEYERLWFASNLPTLKSWLKAGAQAAEHETKPAVRQLIVSLLHNTASSVGAEERRQPAEGSSARGTAPTLAALNDSLAEWSQKAHAELRDELESAFTGRRWRKLGWWKLFWRVDDVAMLTTEMLSQRFMPTAEHELIYLTGRIAELDAAESPYPQPPSSAVTDVSVPEGRRLGSREQTAALALTSSPVPPKWPGHIAFTRRYLQDETVPALQALAQRLVMQSLGTSGIATSLAALLYASSFASSLYEAGAVAALGIVFSLRRMQNKWEMARTFWEGEVREEGRKAVRAAEDSVATVLDKSRANGESEKEAEGRKKTRDLIAKAEDALARMK
ncbi:hypothetical protein RJ55_00980 [Drechmeria coniospora]|nr:hypothetical protein RJ55_00980 [Drechmeria coniospora]